MDKDQILNIFIALKQKLISLKGYHDEKNSLYKGDYSAPSIKLLKDSKIDAITSSRIGWAGTAVDYYLSDLQFDAFENDLWGATRMLIDAGGDEVIYSAEKNAMVGAVSFVASFPTSTGIPINVPFTGSEATGVYDINGRNLKYGIAVKKYDDSTNMPIEWYFFLPGWILILDNDGEILNSVELNINRTVLVDFVHNRDYALRPFGNSLYNTASIKSLAIALRSLKIAEQIGIANIVRSDILLTDANPDDLGTMEFSGAANSLKVMFLNSINGVAGSKFESFDKLSSSDIQDLLVLSAGLFANAVSLPVSVLGIQPSNGSFSSDTIDKLNRPYSQSVSLNRTSFGNSIKKLAVLNLELATGNEVNDFNSITPVFKNSFNPDYIGKIGDAIQKIATVIELPNDIGSFVAREIGLPLRPSVMGVSYPEFNISREIEFNYEKIKNNIIEEDGALYITDDNIARS